MKHPTPDPIASHGNDEPQPGPEKKGMPSERSSTGYLIRVYESLYRYLGQAMEDEDPATIIEVGKILIPLAKSLDEQRRKDVATDAPVDAWKLQMDKFGTDKDARSIQLAMIELVKVMGKTEANDADSIFERKTKEGKKIDEARIHKIETDLHVLKLSTRAFQRDLAEGFSYNGSSFHEKKTKEVGKEEA